MSPYPSSSATDEAPTNRRKRRAQSSRSAASDAVKFSDDDSESEDGGAWEDSLGARHKRRKRDGAGRAVDLSRKLRHPEIWTGGDEERDGDGLPALIHAANVASLNLKCQPTLGVAADDVALKLRYPGSRYPERYATGLPPTFSAEACSTHMLTLLRKIDTSLYGVKIRSTPSRIS